MTDDYPVTAPAMPSDADSQTPNAARLYDYYLGGNHNFERDREFGKRVTTTWPTVRECAMQNRRWLRRIVIDAIDAGVRQFLDMGSGVPTMGNVHEIVRRNLPVGETARVVYVDYEPVAVKHSRLILKEHRATEWATIIQQDIRDPAALLAHPDLLRLIDFDEPVSVMMVFLLHFVGPADDPHQLISTYRDAMCPGSRLSISHLSVDQVEDPEDANQVERVIASYKNTSNPVWLRTRSEIASWFGDWIMVDPGLTRITDWKPDEDDQLAQTSLKERDARQFGWCGVATKPEPTIHA